MAGAGGYAARADLMSIPLAVLLTLAGAAGALGLPPVGWWPLTIAADALLCGAVAVTSRPRAAFWAGWFAGFGYFAVHINWMVAFLADMVGPLAPIPAIPLIAILAAFIGLTTLAARAIGGRGHGALIALPVGVVVLEWLRGLGPLAFPWGERGYALLDTPLASLASLGGLPLLSLAVLATSSVIAAFWVPRQEQVAIGHPRGRTAPAVALLALVLATTTGYLTAESLARPEPGELRRALLVQGSVDPRGRGASLDQITNLYVRLTAEALEELPTGPTPVVIWPESAIVAPLMFIAGEDAALIEALDALPEPERLLLTGIPTLRDGWVRNSLLAITTEGIAGEYAKHRLVPFGEFFPLQEQLPWLYQPFLNMAGMPWLRSTRAGEGTVPVEALGTSYGAMICFESVFPAVARGLAAAGAEVLVLVSNDAWYGTTWGGAQHFALGRLRAVETRRWLLRAGNDGVTAIVDPRGRVTARIPAGAPDVLLGEWRPVTGETLYMRVGDWWLAGLVVVGLALVARERLLV
jgi:apolipoprotein N-acyltransferase